MQDSRKPPLQAQVKTRRRVEFDLEPCVLALLEQQFCADRMMAVLAVTAVAMRLFPHWKILEDETSGLYAIAENPKVLARKARHDG